MIGRWIVKRLERDGQSVVGFDQSDGQDLLDLGAVSRAAVGCSAIVHAGALAHDTAGAPEDIMAVNVLGTWHVLLAAQAAGVSRVVHFSSGQALGIAEGERLPDYFPVDDEHPRRATRPYGLSKRLAEDLCQGFTDRTGIPTVSLRPFAVWEPDTYSQIASQRASDPASEWQPFWEYGAFVDVRDVVEAVTRALTIALSGHHRALLCADEFSGSRPALELVNQLTPTVPVRRPERYVAHPTRALVECETAQHLLGWRAHYRADGHAYTG
jgi:UDP-glucose 4-epimerase